MFDIMSSSQNEEAPPASDDNLSNLGRFYKHCWQEAFYEEENLARCRHLCSELLVDPQLPLLYRVTTNLLFGNLQEPEDAVEFIEQALYWLSKIPKEPDLESIAKEALAKVQAILAKEEEEMQLRVENFVRLAGVDEEDNSSPETAAATTTQSAPDSMAVEGKRQHLGGNRLAKKQEETATAATTRSAFDLMASGAKRQHLSERRSTSPMKGRPAFEPSTTAARRRSLSPTKADRETLLTSWLHPSTPVSAITFKKPKDDNHDDNRKSPSKKRKAG